MSSSPAPLRSSYADDAEFGPLLGLFVEEMPQRIATIESNLDRRDLAGLRVVAHQLKGAGGGYGFAEITAAGRTLERLAETADAEMRDDLDRVRAAAVALMDLCRRASAD